MADETRTHPVTGAVLRRGTRSERVEFLGLSKTVTMPGWYPDGDGDGIHSPDDLTPTSEAFRQLKAEVAAGVAAARKALGLSQRKAGEVLGGGPRAFQKYEKGEVAPSLPMWHLLRLLAAEPALLKHIAPQAALPAAARRKRAGAGRGQAA